MKGIIYKYTGPTGKVYVGQTIHPERRKYRHKTDKLNTHFSRAVQKYGYENFKYEELYVFELEEKMLHQVLNIMEIRLIDELKPEYNMTLGGEGSSGTHMPEELKEQHRKRMKENNPMKRPEIAKKVAERQRGRKGTPMKEDAKKEHSERMKKSNPMKNPETAKKVAEKLRGKKSKNRRKVKYKNFTYLSVEDATKELGFSTWTFYKLVKKGEITYV